MKKYPPQTPMQAHAIPAQERDEIKIYTPHYASQIKGETSAILGLDQAPVRIYECPIKRTHAEKSGETGAYF